MKRLVLISLLPLALVACVGDGVTGEAAEGVSPDLARNWIAFTSSRSGNGDIWAIEPESGELRRLTSHEAADFGPRYSLRDQRLLFASERIDPVNIFALPGRDADLEERPSALFANPAGEEVPDWSSDGREIVYASSRRGNLDIYLADVYEMDADLEGAQRITNLPSAEKQPRLSPDGRLIVYVSDLEGQQDLFVLDREAGVTRNITQHPAMEGHPEWAPDSKSLLFYRFENGDADLFEIAADGTGAAVNLTQSEGNELVGRYSPDGGQIVFGSARSGDWELYLMLRDGSDVRQLTDQEGFDGDPIFVAVP